MNPLPPTPTQAGKIRKPLIVGAGLVIVVMMGALAVHRKRAVPDPPFGEAAETTAEPVSPPKAKVGDEDPVAAEASSVAPPVSPAPSRVQSSQPAAPAARRAAATPESRALMTALTQIDLKSPVTPETAAAFRQKLEQLVRLGNDAVPALREFLELNKDLSFGQS